MKFLMLMAFFPAISFAAPVASATLVKSNRVPGLDAPGGFGAHPRTYLRIEVLNTENHPYFGRLTLKLKSRERDIQLPIFTWPNADVPQVSYLDLGPVVIDKSEWAKPRVEITWEKPR